MGSFSFAELYERTESGSAGGIAPGVYDVTVSDVRFKADSRTLFLDLDVLNGPSAGTTAQITLYIPKEGDKQGAFFNYRRKIAGFQGADLKVAFEAADNAPSAEAAFTVIADALRGKSVTAKIGLNQAEGPYKGTNELNESKPLEGSPTPTPAPVQAEAVTPEPVAVDGQTEAKVPF